MGLAFPKVTATRDRIAYKKQRDQDLREAIAAVWIRDNHRCRCCSRLVTKGGTLGTRGVVHHLVKRSQSRALRAVTSNLVLLCPTCHADIHTYTLVIHGSNANSSLRFERT